MVSMAQTAPPPIPVSNEAQLRAALATAASGDTIRFQNDITVTTAGGGDLPAVVTSLTIEGGGSRSTAAVRTAGCSSMPARSRSTISRSPIRWPGAAMAATAAAAPGLAVRCSCAMAPM